MKSYQTIMDIIHRLSEIWNSDYISKLPLCVKDRGYALGNTQCQKDILITGINPSFREEDKEGNLIWDIDKTLKGEEYDVYWSPVRRLLHNDNIDLRDYATYLDIFYYREKDQKFLRSELLTSPDGIRFVVDQLNLTMNIIEQIIKPKLIIVKNKESWAYFGKYAQEKGWIWMGYTFEPIREYPCGELYRISGLLDSPERIAPEISQTNLVGTLVLFTKHLNQFTKREERPTPELINNLLHSVQSSGEALAQR